MSHTDTRADRPLTRRRYPSNNNNSNASSTNPSNTGELVPISQPYPLVGMGPYMEQLLDHNMNMLFPTTNELVVAPTENSAAHGNYLIEIEDTAVGMNNGSQIFTQIPSIDVRSHPQRFTRGNSRILRNFILMDGRTGNESNRQSTRKSTTYQNNFLEFADTGNVEDAFLFHFDTRSSADLFTSIPINQPAMDDQVEFNSKWQETVPCKYKLDEVFKNYNLKEAAKGLDENQMNFSRELFFAAMFYKDAGDDTEGSNQTDDEV